MARHAHKIAADETPMEDETPAVDATDSGAPDIHPETVHDEAPAALPKTIVTVGATSIDITGQFALAEDIEIKGLGTISVPLVYQPGVPRTEHDAIILEKVLRAQFRANVEQNIKNIQKRRDEAKSDAERAKHVFPTLEQVTAEFAEYKYIPQDMTRADRLTVLLEEAAWQVFCNMVDTHNASVADSQPSPYSWAAVPYLYPKGKGSKAERDKRVAGILAKPEKYGDAVRVAFLAMLIKGKTKKAEAEPDVKTLDPEL